MPSEREASVYSGWMNHKGAKDGDYHPVYCVLKSHQLYMFNVEIPHNRDTYVGGYDICPQTEIKNDKKDKTGTVMELHTARKLKSGKVAPCCGKYKVEKDGDRYLWKAYILGIATGQIPRDLQDKILPGQKQNIFAAIDNVWHSSVPGDPQPPLPPRNPGYGSVSSSRSSGSGHDSGITLPSDRVYPTHRFFKEQEKNLESPSWFFHNCSRDTTEKALEYGHRYGSMLIRENKGDTQCPYRVSFREVEKNIIHHMRISKIDGAFRLTDIQEQVPAFHCLYDIILFFQDKSYKPMGTNDLGILGVREVDYATFLPQAANQLKKSALCPANQDEDYEDPQQSQEQDDDGDYENTPEEVQAALIALERATIEEDIYNIPDEDYENTDNIRVPAGRPASSSLVVSSSAAVANDQDPKLKEILEKQRRRSELVQSEIFDEIYDEAETVAPSEDFGQEYADIDPQPSRKPTLPATRKKQIKPLINIPSPDYGQEYDDVVFNLPTTCSTGAKPQQSNLTDELQEKLFKRRQMMHDVEEYAEAPFVQQLNTSQNRKISAPAVLSHDNEDDGERLYEEAEFDVNQNQGKPAIPRSRILSDNNARTMPSRRLPRQDGMNFSLELAQALEDKFIYQ